MDFVSGLALVGRYLQGYRAFISYVLEWESGAFWNETTKDSGNGPRLHPCLIVRLTRNNAES